MDKNYMLRPEIEAADDWRGWVGRIPFLSLPAGVEWKPIPPFGGAVARFIARANGKEVSVYLDCYDRLGCCGAPYWEIYPFNDDTYRCGMSETDDLIARICEALAVPPNVGHERPEPAAGER